MRRSRWLLVLAVALSLSGCVESFARRSKEGVLSAAQTHLEKGGERSDVATLAAKRAAGGAFEALTTEERQQIAAEMGREMARGATRGIHEELASALGPNGEGPLSQSITGAVERATNSAIFPQCVGPDRSACIQSQIQSIAQAAAGGVVQSLRERLGLGALVLSFVAGALFTLAALGTWTGLRARYPRMPAPPRSATT